MLPEQAVTHTFAENSTCTSENSNMLPLPRLENELLKMCPVNLLQITTNLLPTVFQYSPLDSSVVNYLIKEM